MRAGRLVLSCFIVASSLIAAGCGDDGDSATTGTGASAGGVTAPETIASAGKLVFCSDIAYPPAEFYEGSTPVGYEIDLGKEVASRMGVEAEFQNTGFDGIIGALKSRKCDAIVSSMNSTEERKQEVDFVDYMLVGQSFMITEESESVEDPESLTSLESLSGLAVGVQLGTTLRDALEATSKQLETDGEEPIKIVTFPGAPQAADALRTNKVDVFFADSPVVADYVNKNEGFAFAGEPIDPLPVGFAIRKTDTELGHALHDAVEQLYDDGTFDEILEEWKLSADFRLSDDALANAYSGEAGDGTDTTTAPPS